MIQLHSHPLSISSFFFLSVYHCLKHTQSSITPPHLSDCTTPAPLHSRETLHMLCLSPHGCLWCTHAHTYFKRYVVRRQFLQHVISQPGHHSLSGFSSTWRAVFGLNTEDGVQYILSQFTLVGYVCVWMETKHLRSVIGWQTLWKKEQQLLNQRSVAWRAEHLWKIFLDRNS